jgi:hypothetical protein
MIELYSLVQLPLYVAESDKNQQVFNTYAWLTYGGYEFLQVTYKKYDRAHKVCPLQKYNVSPPLISTGSIMDPAVSRIALPFNVALNHYFLQALAILFSQLAYRSIFFASTSNYL